MALKCFFLIFRFNTLITPLLYNFLNTYFQFLWTRPVSRERVSHSFVSNSMWPWTVARQTPLSMEFSRQGVGCHSLLQGPSWPRDRTRVSCIAGRFFTYWAIREAPIECLVCIKYSVVLSWLSNFLFNFF